MDYEFAGRRLAQALVPVTAALLLTGTALATQNDRDYTLGDDPAEGAVAGNTVGSAAGGTTFDSEGTLGAGDLQDLSVVGSPTYVNASTRPGAGASDLGADFDGTSDSLNTVISMNAPTQMWDNATFFPGPPPAIFPHNYEGIFVHGMQLWAKPDQSALGTAAQTLLFDTSEHGIAITATGRWNYLFDKVAIDSGVSVLGTLNANGWAHVMGLSGFDSPVVGDSAFGGALLVNGVAVAAQNTFYDPSTQKLVLGADPDAGTGYENFYNGVLDDVRLFFWGDNSDQLGQDNAPGGTNTATNMLNADGQNWGPLNLNVDNDWIANEIERLRILAGAASIPDTDLNFDGNTTAADTAIFIANWRKRNVVMGVQVGDWNSRQDGDFNYDGITDLRDAFLLHEGLLLGTGTGLDFSLLGGGVPEPTTGSLMVMMLMALAGVRRRQR